jgi:hypothetical protein
MTELSSGNQPSCNIKHNINLALATCKGLRPEFRKRTPEIYKRLAYTCMSANSNERPTANDI